MASVYTAGKQNVVVQKYDNVVISGITVGNQGREIPHAGEIPGALAKRAARGSQNPEGLGRQHCQLLVDGILACTIDDREVQLRRGTGGSTVARFGREGRSC